MSAVMASGEHSLTAAEPLIQASLLGEAVDSGPVAIFVADEQMRFVAVNQYAASLLGYERAELLELRVTDVVRTPEVVGEFELMMKHRERTGTSVATRKDGTQLELAYRASETRVAGLPLYVSVCWPLA